MQPSLDFVIDLARGAGEILKQGYGTDFRVEYKDIINPVTEVDHRSEDYLVERIRQSFPGHTIITEESGLLEGHKNHCWYLDPLDGTVNFAHGVPMFAVSVGYAEDGEMLHGVVLEPMRAECFAAERGRGATLNGQPIHVSNKTTLIQSLLVTGFPYNRMTTTHTNLKHFSRMTGLTQGVRRLGSAAVDLGYVACGRLDGYWEISLSAWDLAAGVLIVREAGGVVTDLKGDPDVLKPPYDLLAAPPQLHALILKELQASGAE
jgi:myo-inositol-1(or 4)-monophosphatase